MDTIILDSSSPDVLANLKTSLRTIVDTLHIAVTFKKSSILQGYLVVVHSTSKEYLFFRDDHLSIMLETKESILLDQLLKLYPYVHHRGPITGYQLDLLERLGYIEPFDELSFLLGE